ncbi:MAG: class I SAM-dependent methyltransferase, partial [Anaerolineales bacterium]|nr:class I SAM-dependent methyltransferase [Anaerolineales bacterium]
MHSDVEARLLQLNRAFYQRFADSFAETRSRPRPGTMDLLSPVPESASVLDLGCGNGSLARTLAEHDHRGRYVGVDYSTALLAAARRTVEHPRATFVQADLAEPGWAQELAGPFDWVCLLAVLHHIPGQERRARLVAEA